MTIAVLSTPSRARFPFTPFFIYFLSLNPESFSENKKEIFSFFIQCNMCIIIITGGDKKVRIYHPIEHHLIKELEMPDSVISISFSIEDTWMVIGGKEYLWIVDMTNAEFGIVHEQIISRRIRSTSFSPIKNSLME